jgi:murein L,D-transpeptidase YafK
MLFSLGAPLTLRTFSLGLSLVAATLLLSFTLALSQVRAFPRAEAGMQPSNASPGPILIRIFKRESELELWLRDGDRFQLYATYPICFWSGKLGPKEREGDRQAPEGFYSVGLDQLRVMGRHPRSFDIAFPNAFDRALGRSGSYILVHGGCTSIGCFAMTDPVMEKIYQLGEEALRQGQDQIPVHIFPFHMTEANLAPYAGSKWHGFWQDLKVGYDAFEASRLAPNIAVCRGDYVIGPAQSPGDPSTVNVASDACAPERPLVAPSSRPPHLLANRQMAISRSVPAKTHLAVRRGPIAFLGRPTRISALAHSRRRMR